MNNKEHAKNIVEELYDHLERRYDDKGCDKIACAKIIVKYLDKNFKKTKQYPPAFSNVSSRFRIGDYIRIKRDTTKFLKENNYWLEEYDLAGINNIDGMTGIIKGDYTDLKGDESHYVVALVNIDMSGIGIHPDYIMAI